MLRLILAIILILGLPIVCTAGQVKIEKIAYGGWLNCIRMTNGNVELVATTDVGPRIIRFGFVGKENIFCELPSQAGKTGSDKWMSFGGHRLWHAPEAKPRTYFPDSVPIKYEISGDTLRLLPDVEPTNGMQKEIELKLDPNSNHVTIVHKIHNRTLWPIELAPWALTMMRAGGKAILPQEPYAPHPDIPDYPGQKTDQANYLPVRKMVLWSYSDLGDPRWIILSKYIVMKQDPDAKKPIKVGFNNRRKWAAYLRNGDLFVKAAAYKPETVYPDEGCSFEAFTNSDMLELETLGPLTRLDPGATISHTEDWYLFDNVKCDNTDKSIDENVLPNVKSVVF